LQIQKEKSKDVRILVVDDVPPMRQLIAEALHQAGPFLVSEAENGKEAIEQCRQHSFDLVISDVVMPEMGGMELLSQLAIVSPQTSIIMMTAQPATELTVSAMKKGAVDFLQKPFQIDELLAKVQLCLHEKALFNGYRGKKTKTRLALQDKSRELSVHSYIHDVFQGMVGDRGQIFKKITELAMQLVDGQDAALLTYDQEDGSFLPELVVGGGKQKDFEEKTLPALQAILREVADKQEAVMIHSDRPELSPSLICAPLMIRKNVFGVLCVRKKSMQGLFGAEDLHHITVLTGKASLSLENHILYESLFDNVFATFKSLITSIQLRDQYTEEHSRRVAALAAEIAQEVNCGDREIESLKISALLHDIGKIAIPDGILLKPDAQLSSEERKIIETHPDIAEKILKPVLLFDQEREIIRHHHERWDGKGYPDGLAGEDIPLLSRILSVADAFDAMVHVRPYRNAVPAEGILREMKKERGRQFDSAILDVFLAGYAGILERTGIHEYAEPARQGTKAV